ncbi:hypothetical protein [Polaromonas sp.]
MNKHNHIRSLAFLAMISFGSLVSAQALNSRETQAFRAQPYR